MLLDKVVDRVVDRLMAFWRSCCKFRSVVGSVVAKPLVQSRAIRAEMGWGRVRVGRWFNGQGAHEGAPCPTMTVQPMLGSLLFAARPVDVLASAGSLKSVKGSSEHVPTHAKTLGSRMASPGQLGVRHVKDHESSRCLLGISMAILGLC